MMPSWRAMATKCFALALNRVLEGQYCFQVSPLPADAAAPAAGQDRCVVEDDAAPAWVVIAPQSDWPRLVAQWKSYRAWFRQLEDSGAAPGVVVTVRRAVLSSLADTVEER
jgi:hypothetical protein